MTPLEAIVIVVAGAMAGIINTVVGSGSLITYPTLLALGYPPVLANVTNSVGLTPGSISGAVGYRGELVGQRSVLTRLGVLSFMGGLTGGALLLALPSATFVRVVPVMILLATLLVALQPRLTALLVRRRGKAADLPLPLLTSIFLCAVYGGYFGAAQGVILVAVLGIFLSEDLQTVIGVKNVLQAIVNATAAALFILTTPIAWVPALLLALGSTIGGQIGARVGRRLPPRILRGGVILVGTIVGLKLLAG